MTTQTITLRCDKSHYRLLSLASERNRWTYRKSELRRTVTGSIPGRSGAVSLSHRLAGVSMPDYNTDRAESYART